MASAIPASAGNRLRAFMLRWAELAGDAHPEWVRAVATSIGEARRAATPGNVVYDGLDGEPGYLVTMKGSFTRLTDSSLIDRDVPLDRYGPVSLLAVSKES